MAPACLPSKPIKPTRNIKCFASGWGKTLKNEPHDKLLAAKILLSDRNGYETCHAMSDIYVQKYEICAQPAWTATCMGDSGGPLVCEGKYKMVKIIVVLRSCGLAGVHDCVEQ